MHLSRYCKTYPSDEDPENAILFSSRNAAIVEIPDTIARTLPNADLTRQDIRTLRRLGFLVDNPASEQREILRFIKEMDESNRTLSIRLVMDLDCNLACKYCFEGKRKGKYYMAPETADRFIEMMRRRLISAARPIDFVFITFYGGEPLMNRELVIHVAKKMKALAKDMHVRFGFAFITNGTLLSKDLVKTLKPLGLHSAHITLDGPKEIHDSFRPFKGGQGSFATIIKNVKDVCRSTRITIGGNFSKRNYRRFPELLDYLLADNLPPSRVQVVGFFPALSERSDVGPDFNDGCVSMNEPWLFKANLLLREEILKRGYRLDTISPGPCTIEFENSILVNYDGTIYKCPGMIGRKEFCVGNIWHGVTDYRQSHNLDNWKNEECLNCSYLPLCFGGCRHMKFVRDGNMEGVDCKKPYFDACLETLVKQDIKYGLTAE